MERKLLKSCPLCGAKLNGDSENGELLSKMQKIYEQGIFQETMYIAVRIVESYTNGYEPTWFKSILDEHDVKLERAIANRLLDDLRPHLREMMERLGNPQSLGKVQEEYIAKRLSALKIGKDEFTTENSKKAGEDVLCIVKEQEQVIGKIVIESKKTKSWRQKFVEQTLNHMKRQNTDFGILATTKMPDDALSCADLRNNVLVVRLDSLEIAYLFMREYVRRKKDLENDYSLKLSKLELKDRILQELRESVMDKELDKIAEAMNTLATHIDSTVTTIKSQIIGKLELLQKSTSTDTNKIRALINRLVSDHIEKIRVQLTALNISTS